MKIIGGHDYYDGAGLGVDETLVFVRRAKELTQTPFKLSRRVGFQDFDDRLDFQYVVVAGKLYPMVNEYRKCRLSDRKDNRGERIYDGPTQAFHYTPEDAMAALERHKAIVQSRGGLFGAALLRDTASDIECHFRETQKPDWTDWLISNRVITGIVRRGRDRRDPSCSVTANCDGLKDIEFFRVLDPATIHMEISNYIGGVLPHSTEIVTLSSEDRLIKAGFDKKASFRKAPGAKKRRKG